MGQRLLCVGLLASVASGPACDCSAGDSLGRFAPSVRLVPQALSIGPVPLGAEETAQVLGISRRTVQGDWKMARTWLRRELAP